MAREHSEFDHKLPASCNGSAVSVPRSIVTVWDEVWKKVCKLVGNQGPVRWELARKRRR